LRYYSIPFEFFQLFGNGRFSDRFQKVERQAKRVQFLPL